MTDSGRLISIEYTLTLDDGEAVDTNVGSDPLIYAEGAEQILPALEAALHGAAAGEQRSVTLTPDDGYGQVDPDKFFEVDLDQIPEDAREPGTTIVAEDEEGNHHHLRVHEQRELVLVLDANHPLAGETLHFQIKVLDVK